MNALAVAAALFSSSAGAQTRQSSGSAVQAGLTKSADQISTSVFVPQHMIRSELASAPFRARLVDKAATIKARSMSYDWNDGSLTVNIMRAKSQRRQYDLPGFNFNRYSVMATDVGLVEEVSGQDSISAGLSFALENRRPSINIAAHNIYRTSNLAATLGWAHNSTFRLDANLFATKPMTQRSDPERLVEIAGGAPFSTSGVSLIASFSPMHDLTKFSYGAEMTSQRVSQRDSALLFGAPSQRSDIRMGLFVRKSF